MVLISLHTVQADQAFCFPNFYKGSFSIVIVRYFFLSSIFNKYLHNRTTCFKGQCLIKLDSELSHITSQKTEFLQILY